MKDIHPCTIINDRYSGCYSGGKWTAWPLDMDQISDGYLGGDPDEMMLFSDETLIYGKGDTPDQAYKDLINKMTIIHI